MASEWFYTRDGKTKIGPVSSAELQTLAKSGQLRPTDLVWREGMAKWTLKPLSLWRLVRWTALVLAGKHDGFLATSRKQVISEQPSLPSTMTTCGDCR